MKSRDIPNYAVFDDHRYSQRIAVFVRWFLIVIWLLLQNYRPDVGEIYFIINNGLVVTLAVVNAYLHWRIWKGRPITRPYVLGLSIMDVCVITAGIGVSSRFDNNFFILYYPALLALSLVFSSRRLSFTFVTLVAMAYIGLSLTLEPGVRFDIKEEKILVIKVATMFAVVAAGNLMTRIERMRRREAVEAERFQSERNLELQRKAQEAELAAQQERDRIAREIHDGIAQSIYGLSLNLETCADLAERVPDPLREHLQKLVPLAKKTLLETRHYIFDLKPLLSGESDLVGMADNQVKEFQTVAGTPTHLSVEGQPCDVSVAVSSGLYRVMQEALANVLKHARASKVEVALAFEPEGVRLSVQDDGDGFHPDGIRPGYGLGNMRQRAEELGGRFEMSSVPGQGTSINVTLPAQEVNRDAY